MSPAQSRKRLPADWQAYDDARELAFKLRARARVIGEPAAADLKWLAAPAHESARVIELLDTLCGLLRERIEADAKGGGT